MEVKKRVDRPRRILDDRMHELVHLKYRADLAIDNVRAIFDEINKLIDDMVAHNERRRESDGV